MRGTRARRGGALARAVAASRLLHRGLRGGGSLGRAGNRGGAGSDGLGEGLQGGCIARDGVGVKREGIDASVV